MPEIRKISVSIKGVCPLLINKMVSSAEDRKESKRITKILQKDPDDEEAYKISAELKTYRNDKAELCIPSTWLEACLVRAGVSERIEGKGRKTYKDTMNAFVVVDEQMIPLTTQEYELDRRFVRIQKSRIMKTRPKIAVGWEASFTVTVLDETLPIDIFRKIFDHAGYYVGIGDWRPKFGRFEVTAFTEIK